MFNIPSLCKQNKLTKSSPENDTQTDQLFDPTTTWQLHYFFEIARAAFKLYVQELLVFTQRIQLYIRRIV